MKETGIIFSTSLIPGLLDGSKTQTRRTRGLELINQNPDGWYLSPSHKQGMVLGGKATFVFDSKAEYGELKMAHIGCPYGQVGDRLWVRETWAQDINIADGATGTIYYKAGYHPGGLKWRSPIHMPRWASRILLEITEVRVERLQEITNEDAIAEGIKPPQYAFRMLSGGDIDATESPKELFAELWESLNAKRYPWSMNPWPWVLGLRRVNA